MFGFHPAEPDREGAAAERSPRGAFEKPAWKACMVRVASTTHTFDRIDVRIAGLERAQPRDVASHREGVARHPKRPVSRAMASRVGRRLPGFGSPRGWQSLRGPIPQKPSSNQAHVAVAK